MSNNMEHADCGFYFMYRRNKEAEWVLLLNRPFLLNITNQFLTGQFISSNWFKMRLEDTDNPDFIVLRLPKSDNGIHPSETITVEIIVTRLNEAELNNHPFTNLTFVVLHKQYSIKDIDVIRQKLVCEVNKENTNTNVGMNEVVNITNTAMFGLRFDVLETENLECYVSCPRFELKRE